LRCYRGRRHCGGLEKSVCQLGLKQGCLGGGDVVIFVVITRVSGRRASASLKMGVVTVVANNALGMPLGGAVLAVAVLVRGNLATARQSLSGLKRRAGNGLETDEAIHDGLI
jgi:hypothetical protein